MLDIVELVGRKPRQVVGRPATARGPVNSNAGARDGAPLRLAVDLNNMHLLNEVTGVVL
jgi:multiple sugar transport system ATP-binding protein